MGYDGMTTGAASFDSFFAAISDSGLGMFVFHPSIKVAWVVNVA